MNLYILAAIECLDQTSNQMTCLFGSIIPCGDIKVATRTDVTSVNKTNPLSQRIHDIHDNFIFHGKYEGTRREFKTSHPERLGGYVHWGYNILCHFLPLRHRDRKPCSSRDTVVVKSHLSPSEVYTGHRTGHYNRSSDNLAVHSECIHCTIIMYSLHNNHHLRS